MFVIYLANWKKEGGKIEKKSQLTWIFEGKYAILDITSDLSKRINFHLIEKMICRLVAISLEKRI